MAEKLIVQASPHIHMGSYTPRIMGLVLIALTPSAIAAVWLFGWRALLLIAVCVVSSVLFEYLACKMWKRPSPINDLSAAVTGLLLALNLPATLPIPMAVLGCAFAIVVVKQLFGGIGQNFANPALAARVLLLASFTQAMTRWTAPLDGVTCATPLALLGQEGAALPAYGQLLLGLHGGSMGETCAAVLLAGGIFLIVTKVIRPVIPLTYLGTVALFSLALGQDPLYQLLSGGLLLGAFFMATDYTTSPVTDKGKFVYALGCGVLTVVIRRFGSYPEGVSFAILLMNLVTPLIDRGFLPKPFGGQPEPARKGGEVR